MKAKAPTPIAATATPPIMPPIAPPDKPELVEVEALGSMLGVGEAATSLTVAAVVVGMTMPDGSDCEATALDSAALVGFAAALDAFLVVVAALAVVVFLAVAVKKVQTWS
jgi:hypothetical protein